MADTQVLLEVLLKYGVESAGTNEFVNKLSKIDNALKTVETELNRVDKAMKDSRFTAKEGVVFGEKAKRNIKEANVLLRDSARDLLKFKDAGKRALITATDAIAKFKDVGGKETSPEVQGLINELTKLGQIIDIDTEKLKEMQFAVKSAVGSKTPLSYTTQGGQRKYDDPTNFEFAKRGGENQAKLKTARNIKTAVSDYDFTNAERFGSVLDNLTLRTKGLTRATTKMNVVSKHGDESTRGFANTIRNLTSSSVLLLGPLSAVGARIATVGSIAIRSSKQVALLLGTFAAITLGTYALSKAVFSVGIELDKVSKRLRVTEGATILAKNAINELKDLANATGNVLIDMAEGYSKLNFASVGTKLEGAKVKKVFEDVTFAIAKMQLGADEAKGIFKALEQIMSKGTVQAEELRGQLGDRLVGSFNIAARAMNVTTAELNKMLKAGRVISDEFLPKFAAELRRTYGAEGVEVIETATGALNRLKNSFTILFDEMNQSLKVSKIVIWTFDALSKVMYTLANNIGLLLAVGHAAFWATLAKGVTLGVGKIKSLNSVFLSVSKRIAVLSARTGTAIPLLTKLGIALSFKRSGILPRNIKQVTEEMKKFSNTGAGQKIAYVSNHFNNLAAATSLYSKSAINAAKNKISKHLNTATKSSKTLNKAVTVLSNTFPIFTSTIGKATKFVWGFIRSLTAMKIFAIVLGITALVSVVSLLGDKWKKTKEEIIRYNQEQAIAITGTQDAIAQTRQNIKEIDAQLKKLSARDDDPFSLNEGNYGKANEEIRKLNLERKKSNEILKKQIEVLTQRENIENSIFHISSKRSQFISKLHQQEVLHGLRIAGESKNYVSSVKRQIAITNKYNKMRDEFRSNLNPDAKKNFNAGEGSEFIRITQYIDNLKSLELDKINFDANLFGEDFIHKAESAGVLIEQNKEKVKKFREQLEGQFTPGSESSIAVLVADYQAFLDLKVKEKFDKLNQSLERTNLKVEELGKYKPDLKGLADTFKRTDAIDSFREKIKALTSDTQTINEYVANFTKSYDALVDAQENAAARLEFWANMESTAKTAIDGVGAAIANLIVGQKSLLQSLADVARSAATSIIKELFKVYVARKAYGFIESSVFGGTPGTTFFGRLINTAGSAVVGGSTGSGGSGGNISTPNPRRQYAKGGVVNSITPFLNNNKPSVMGEAGPEAILPLARTSKGDLGVQLASDQSTSKSANITNVYNLTVNTQSTGNQQADDFNAKRNAKEITNALKHMQTQSDNQRSNQLNQRVSTS